MLKGYLGKTEQGEFGSGIVGVLMRDYLGFA